MTPPIVLAYAGSPRSLASIPGLGAQHGADVVTVTLDLGAVRDLEAARDRALSGGAVRAHVLDLREEFARAFILPALRAGAAHDLGDAMPALLARPIVARALVEIASMERTATVAHAPSLVPHVAALDARLRSVVPAAPAHPSWIRTNLWGRTLTWLEAGDGATPVAPPYELTRPLSDCPAEPAVVELSFTSGVPSSVNGVTMPLPVLFASLGMIVGAHGVGRSELLDAAHGRSWRVVSEAPASVALHTAHDHLAERMAPADLARVARLIQAEYRDVVRQGRWFTPLREALDAFVDRREHGVTGAVRLRLFKGSCEVVGESPATALPRTLALEPV